MNNLLYSIHDREGAPHVPSGGWCVDTISLSEGEAPTDYRNLKPDINWLVRLNYGYGSTGTIPLPIRQDDYMKRLVNYVGNSSGAYAYIIGNEPNHENERPNGVVITPERYVDCFAAARDAIKRINPSIRVIPAPLAPYH